MFGRKKKAQKREEHQQSLRKGLLFWLPGGSSRLDVYVDYCVIRCLGKTKMKEKERVIPFTSIQDVVYTPPTAMRLACLQLITKEMPDVKKSYWYAYENNLVVVHPSTEELAHKVRAYILNPKGSDVVPPEYLNQLRKELKRARRQRRKPRPRRRRRRRPTRKRTLPPQTRRQRKKAPPLELRTEGGVFAGILLFPEGTGKMKENVPPKREKGDSFMYEKLFSPGASAR